MLQDIQTAVEFLSKRVKSDKDSDKDNNRNLLTIDYTLAAVRS